MKLRFAKNWKYLLVFFWCFSHPAGAISATLKTNEQIYQNPFDLSGGGASLTRATQEGVLFSNPSLSAFGAGFFRWIYMRTSFHAGADAADFILKTAKQTRSGGIKVDAALFDKALKTPIHAGNDIVAGFITANGGFSVIETARIDLEGRQFGSQGLPEFRLKTQVVTGGMASLAKSLTDFFSFGIAAKYLYVGEINEVIGLQEVAGGQGQSIDISSKLKIGQGIGIDAGSTFQVRARNFDLRLAGVVQDVLGTRFKGKIATWKQTINAGIGITTHTRSDAIHCAADLRDITAAYGEHWTRRSYAGCKILFTNWIGLGAGLYQGWPTYGIVLNLILMRLEAGSYTREFGSQVGTRGRRVYFVSMGFEI